jgi:hypothetical protein
VALVLLVACSGAHDLALPTLEVYLGVRLVHGLAWMEHPSVAPKQLGPASSVEREMSLDLALAASEMPLETTKLNPEAHCLAVRRRKLISPATTRITHNPEDSLDISLETMRLRSPPISSAMQYPKPTVETRLDATPSPAIAQMTECCLAQALSSGLAELWALRSQLR